MQVKKSFKYRLYPSRKTEQIMLNQLKICRFVYNQQLAYHKDIYKNEGRTANKFEMNNRLVKLKKQYNISQVHSQVLQDISRRISDAFHGFFVKLKQGLKAGTPRFKGKYRYKSTTYPQSGFKLKGNKLRLSKVGSINIKLHRELKGSVKTLTVKRMPSGKWFAIFTTIIDIEKRYNNPHVGVDIGIDNFAVLSDGIYIKNPKYLKKSEDKLALIQRRFSRKRKSGKNRSKYRIKVARIYEKIANQRLDYAHKVSRYLADNYSIISFEKLQITNMLKNHYLAKSISDSAWSQLIQLTSYKAEEAGGREVLVDPYGTSQECSNCGNLVPKTLSVRTHKCPYCGIKIDRDYNSSKLIDMRGLKQIGQELSEYTPLEMEPLPMRHVLSMN